LTYERATDEAGCPARSVENPIVPKEVRSESFFFPAMLWIKMQAKGYLERIIEWKSRTRSSSHAEEAEAHTAMWRSVLAEVETRTRDTKKRHSSLVVALMYWSVVLRDLSRTAKATSPAFVDRIRVFVKAGTGGQGSKVLSRSGGDGGDVLVRAVDGIHSFNHLQNTKFKAGSGSNACRQVLFPSQGEGTTHVTMLFLNHQYLISCMHPVADLEIHVPVGTTVLNDRGQVMGDLDSSDQRLTVAFGGIGGSLRTSVKFCGTKGDQHHVILELKSIADVGLVGFPNAGKSSFLGRKSKAKPKVADYAFTTLRPQVGVVEFPDFTQIRIADIPGLIEGAHQNQGMGHDFLRHVERTKVLLFLVDVSGFQLREGLPHRSARECLHLLQQELDLYKASLRTTRPSVLAVNKIDLPGAQESFQEFNHQLQQSTRDPTIDSIFPVSILTGEGLSPLIMRLRELVGSVRSVGQGGESVEEFRTKLFRPAHEYMKLRKSVR
jgi:Obg family GTPase CgtA